MYNEEKDIITHCKKCNKIMIVKDYKVEISSDIYVKNLGYKSTNRFWCKFCFYEKFNEIRLDSRG